MSEETNLHEATARLKRFRRACMVKLAGGTDADFLDAIRASEMTHGDLDLIIAAIEAMTDKGIPIHPTALAEKGIPGLATREVEGE